MDYSMLHTLRQIIDIELHWALVRHDNKCGSSCVCGGNRQDYSTSTDYETRDPSAA